MKQITSVRITASENSHISHMIKAKIYDPSNPSDTIDLLERADSEMFNRNKAKGFGGYDKTYVEIEWDDGFVYSLRYDLGDNVTIAERLNPKALLETIIRREGGEHNVPPQIIQQYKHRIEMLEGRMTVAKRFTMAKKAMSFNVKVDADGYCWQIISLSEAKNLWRDTNKDVYVLCDDDTQFLVENAVELEEGTTFGIALGYITTESLESVKYYLSLPISF